MKDIEIIEAVSNAVALHKDSVENLRERMSNLLDPLPSNVVLEVGGHTISYRKVSGSCSQWANNVYPVTNSERAYVIDDAYLLTIPDLDFFDGSNFQHHFGGYYLGEQRIRPARAELLRCVAADLPAALMQYVECARRGAAENAALVAEA